MLAVRVVLDASFEGRITAAVGIAGQRFARLAECVRELQ
jgi:hypothetical protein